MIEKSVLDAAGLADAERELVEITWRMLHAIHTGDAETYAALSDEELSCFEDVCAYRIDGLEFHLALIRQTGQNPEMQPARFDILTPRVQLHGDTAIVTYTRLMTYEKGGLPLWKTFNETRVFLRREEHWKMVHFHRSPTS